MIDVILVCLAVILNDDDDVVYLEKLQTRSVKKSILYM
jgi:hypothetical protein